MPRSAPLSQTQGGSGASPPLWALGSVGKRVRKVDGGSFSCTNSTTSLEPITSPTKPLLSLKLPQTWVQTHLIPHTFSLCAQRTQFPIRNAKGGSVDAAVLKAEVFIAPVLWGLCHTGSNCLQWGSAPSQPLCAGMAAGMLCALLLCVCREVVSSEGCKRSPGSCRCWCCCSLHAAWAAAKFKQQNGKVPGVQLFPKLVWGWR